MTTRFQGMAAMRGQRETQSGPGSAFAPGCTTITPEGNKPVTSREEF